MVKKAGVVPQAGGQPQVCYWVLRGALPKGEKVFWRPVRGILFTKIVENVVFPKKLKKYQKKRTKIAPRKILSAGMSQVLRGKLSANPSEPCVGDVQV